MFLSSPTPESIAAAAAELRPGPGELLMVLVAERQRPDLGALVRELSRLDCEFFGGLFPGLLHGDRSTDQGALLLKLPATTPPLLVKELDQDRPTLAGLEGLTPPREGTQTAVVLVDGLTANVSRLLAELHSRLGDSTHYIGGGAGPLTLVQEPCVFTREGVHQDAAVIAFVNQRSQLGVRHGWHLHAGPVVATRTRGNVIEELNWRNAFEVYREAVEPHIETDLTPENCFTASTAFPFGIYKEGEEDVVRDPVAVGAAGELICVGEVPENAVLNILRGDRASLVEAAAQAADDCTAGEPVRARCAVVVDCVSRTLFLEDEFERELRAVRTRLEQAHPDIEMWGMLTLGEISSTGKGYVEFFNKTIVAAVLHD